MTASASPPAVLRQRLRVLALVLLALVLVASIARTALWAPPPTGTAADARAAIARIWIEGGATALAVLLLCLAPSLLQRLRGGTQGAPAPRGLSRPPTPTGDDLLAVAGDRLRQPLHAMGLYTGSLARDASPGQEVALRGLENSVRALARVLDDIEQTVDLLHDDVPVRPVPTAVAGVFATLVVEGDAGGAGRVALHRRPGALWIDSDPRLAALLLQLLVDDAARRAHRRVLVAARPAGAFVQVQVRDDGPPLAACARGDALPMLVRRARDESARDDGLGLAVGARIVELLALDVALQPHTQRGNTLWVAFPRARAPRAMAPDDATVLSVAAEARGGGQARCRIDGGRPAYAECRIASDDAGSHTPPPAAPPRGRTTGGPA